MIWCTISRESSGDMHQKILLKTSEVELAILLLRRIPRNNHKYVKIIIFSLKFYHRFSVKVLLVPSVRLQGMFHLKCFLAIHFLGLLVNILK